LTARVLIIDDDGLVRRAVRRSISALGYDVLEAYNGEEGLAQLAAHHVDVALVDMWMPGISGLEVLTRARSVSPDTECVVVTGHGDVETATRCLEAGAADYFEKPISDWPRFQQVLKRAAEFATLRRETQSLRDEGGEGLLLGHSAAMSDVRFKLKRMAGSSAPVLLHGESGTGKELVARTLHKLSGRSGAFVGVNVGALPEQLLESELFGAKQGAHSTAMTDRDGYFAQADQGTLLLDEIGEMSPHMQVKLLRALESREFQPLGAGRTQPLTARVIAATHRDLVAEVRAGRFRNDLLYRLHVLELRLPPLRERGGDVALLTYRFVHEFNQVEARNVQRVTPEALRKLEARPWPGNVRELRNVIRRAVILAPGEELTDDLLTEVGDGTPLSQVGTADDPFGPWVPLEYGKAKEEAMGAFTRAYLVHHLRVGDGVVAKAARSAGMQRPNFRRLMTRYGVEAEDVTGKGLG